MLEFKLQWEDNNQTYSYTLDNGQPVSIGRAVNNVITLHDGYVSRSHAEIWRQGNVCYVRNVSATNPVRLSNKKKLAQGETYMLQMDEHFRIGRIWFQVVIPGPKLKCPRCKNIVEYKPNEDCPHCGLALHAAQTIRLG